MLALPLQFRIGTPPCCRMRSPAEIMNLYQQACTEKSAHREVVASGANDVPRATTTVGQETGRQDAGMVKSAL